MSGEQEFEAPQAPLAERPDSEVPVSDDLLPEEVQDRIAVAAEEQAAAEADEDAAVAETPEADDEPGETEDEVDTPEFPDLEEEV